MSIDWKKFAETMRSHERFLLTSHIRPDCDALGSELGMAGVLRAIGKEVHILNGQATPPPLRFIDPENQIRALGEQVPLDKVPAHDALVILDTSAWAQLGPMGEVVRNTTAKKYVLDHHAGEDDLGAVFFKNTRAEAAGRLVVEAADALGVALTPEIARPLYAAIATDTGWMRFGSTTGDTYRVVARLVDAGASPPEIYRELYEQDTLGRLKLRGRILARTETDLEGRLAHTHVLKNDFTETGALASDTEDVINMTLTIAGVEFAVILIEQAEGDAFKISFRSRCEVDCNQLAKQFGGGGHKAAAGAFLKGPFPEVQTRILDAVRAALR